MSNKVILGVFASILIASSVFFTGYSKKNNPKELYHVYLKGKTIGYIESKEDLENYINNEEQDLKNKYNVDNVYTPNDLDIIKETTYNQEVSDISIVYSKIKSASPFTIKGYVVTIKGVEKEDEEDSYISSDVVINVLDKNVFEDAIKKTMFVFVSEDTYNKFVNQTQEEIVDIGKKVEDIYIKNEISIKEAKISVDDDIFVDSELLSKYLLFGTLETQKTYKIKSGDTIEQVSFDNKLSVEEFLIANTEFTGADNLLFPGQMVTLGVIKPAFELVEEDHIIELEDSKYKTEIVYDDNMVSGFERVKQQGKNGVNKVTKKMQKENGKIVSAVVISSEVITPVVNKIIVRGNGSISVGSLGSWAWPTTTPYIISSNYAWRWGSFHAAIDITGTGYGSPIYAANDGVVEESGYNGTSGNYIIINHNNGFYTVYAHLSKRMAKKGDIVSIGQQIGKMGQTGFATGTHLHFGVWKGYPYRGTSINPMLLY